MATRSRSQSEGEKLDLLRRIKAVAAHLDRLLFEQDSAAALGAARELLQSSELDEANRESLAAGILIDAGTHMKDRSAVEDGTALFRRLSERMPGSTDCGYNLANGLNALAELVQEPPWSPKVSAWRREARVLYARAATEKGTAAQRSRALTNDANLLRKSYRRLEAYDAYVAALRADPRNGVASSGVARLLYEIVDAGLGPKTLRNLAARYLAQAKISEDEIVKYAGPHALKNIRALAVRATESPIKKRRRPAGYAGFVWEHRLALSLSIELVKPSDRSWDRLSFHSVSEPIERERTSRRCSACGMC